MGFRVRERRRRETEGGVFWPRGLTLSRLLRMVFLFPRLRLWGQTLRFVGEDFGTGRTCSWQGTFERVRAEERAGLGRWVGRDTKRQRRLCKAR